MNKKGLVTQVNKNIVILMTPDGEFVRVKAKGGIPSIGEIYTGEVYAGKAIFRLPSIAAAVFMFVFLGSGIYSYYTPVSAITIDSNSSVRLELNRWNRIIKASALNEDGEKLLSSLNLKFKPAEKGLDLLFEQAKKNNFIDEQFKTGDKSISIHVEEPKEDKVNLSKFREKAEKDNLKVTVTEDIKKVRKKSSNGSKNDTDKGNSKQDNKNKSKDSSSKNKKDKDINGFSDSGVQAGGMSDDADNGHSKNGK